MKDVGWTGFSVERRADAAVEHGPDPARAAGRRRLGRGPDLVLDRRDAGAHELRVDAGRQPEVQSRDRGEDRQRVGKTPEALLAYFVDQLVDRAARLERHRRAVSNYLHATGAWTGSDAQLQAKAAGLVHLIAGSPEYQLV